MKKLAVFFPGIGYTIDKPLLHYSRKLVTDAGYEVKLLPYSGFPQKVKGDRDKMLESYRYIQTRIDSNLDQIQVLRSRTQKVTTTYHDAPGGGSGSDVSDQIGKIVKLEAFVKEDMARLQDELILVRFLLGKWKSIRLVQDLVEV